jgi:hypothetical protein
MAEYCLGVMPAIAPTTATGFRISASLNRYSQAGMPLIFTPSLILREPP